jgi:hypothetical protein
MGLKNTVRKTLAAICNSQFLSHCFFLTQSFSVDNLLIFLFELPVFLGVLLLGEKISSRMLGRFTQVQDNQVRESKQRPILKVIYLG